MKFRKRGKFFYVFYRTPNGTKCVSTKVGNLCDAKIVARDAGIRQIEFAAMAGLASSKAVMSIFGGRRNKGIKSLVDMYSGWMKTVSRSPFYINDCRITLNAWMRTCGTANMFLADIREAHVDPYINRVGDAKATTREVQLNQIRSFFDWAQKNGYCVGNPAELAEVDLSLIPHLQQEPKKRMPFTDEEYAKILEVADKRGDCFWRAAIRIGRHTALRLSDVACMEWDSITWDTNTIVVHTRKTDSRVEITTDKLVDVFKEVKKDASPDAQYLFPIQRSTYINPDTRPYLCSQFKYICTKAGVFGLSFHSLRHAALSEEAATNGIESAQKLAGHASEKTTFGYCHST